MELAATRITTSDVLELRVGDIIASEKDVHQPLLVYVEGEPKFWASPGQFKGRKAIQVQTGFKAQEMQVGLAADAAAAKPARG